MILSYQIIMGKTMRIRVPKTIVPGEAREIAGRFRQAANEARSLSSQLQGVGGHLDATWEGVSKNRFMDEFNPAPGNLLDYANYLEQCASKIERMTVIIWEEKEVEGPDRR